MRKSKDNILGLLKRGADFRISSADFTFPELQRIAEEAATQESRLSILVNSNLTFDELSLLASICKNTGIELDLSD
ncbi:MAG: hypothetical protein NC212_08395 [Staphylococcus sp.]|nr:hypothetical protein [Staphylococcus sp.]